MCGVSDVCGLTCCVAWAVVRWQGLWAECCCEAQISRRGCTGVGLVERAECLLAGQIVRGSGGIELLHGLVHCRNADTRVAFWFAHARGRPGMQGLGPKVCEQRMRKRKKAGFNTQAGCSAAHHQFVCYNRSGIDKMLAACAGLSHPMKAEKNPVQCKAHSDTGACAWTTRFGNCLMLLHPLAVAFPSLPHMLTTVRAGTGMQHFILLGLVTSLAS